MLILYLGSGYGVSTQLREIFLWELEFFPIARIKQ